MKRNLLFTFASVLTLVVGFISCTNDEFDECFPVPATTRSVTEAVDSTITLEEVQARLSNLNKKYGARVFINEDLPASKFDDAFFLRIENLLRKDLGLEPISSYVLEDSEIDCIPVAYTNSGVESGIESEVENGVESNEDYTDEDWVSWSEYISFTLPDIHNPYNKEISVFKTHAFTLSYMFKRDIISQYDDIRVTNSTNINKDNLLPAYKNGDLDYYAKKYNISYVDNSFYIQGCIHHPYPGKDPRSYAFNYYFDIMIGSSKIRIIASHYCNVLGYQLLE